MYGSKWKKIIITWTIIKYVRGSITNGSTNCENWIENFVLFLLSKQSQNQMTKLLIVPDCFDSKKKHVTSIIHRLLQRESSLERGLLLACTYLLSRVGHKNWGFLGYHNNWITDPSWSRLPAPLCCHLNYSLWRLKIYIPSFGVNLDAFL